MNDETLLDVTYHDGKNAHTLTVKEFKKRFQEEGTEWVQGVLSQLETQGSVSLRFGTYKLHSHDN